MERDYDKLKFSFGWRTNCSESRRKMRQRSSFITEDLDISDESDDEITPLPVLFKQLEELSVSPSAENHCKMIIDPLISRFKHRITSVEDKELFFSDPSGIGFIDEQISHAQSFLQDGKVDNIKIDRPSNRENDFEETLKLEASFEKLEKDKKKEELQLFVSPVRLNAKKQIQRNISTPGMSQRKIEGSKRKVGKRRVGKMAFNIIYRNKDRRKPRKKRKRVNKRRNRNKSNQILNIRPQKQRNKQKVNRKGRGRSGRKGRKSSNFVENYRKFRNLRGKKNQIILNHNNMKYRKRRSESDVILSRNEVYRQRVLAQVEGDSREVLPLKGGRPTTRKYVALDLNDMRNDSKNSGFIPFRILSKKEGKIFPSSPKEIMDPKTMMKNNFVESSDDEEEEDEGFNLAHILKDVKQLENRLKHALKVRKHKKKLTELKSEIRVIDNLEKELKKDEVDNE